MKISFISLILLLLSFVCQSQNEERSLVESQLNKQGETIILIKATDDQANTLSRLVSLDGKKGNEWKAYVNKKQFADFLNLGLYYRCLPKEETKSASMANSISQMESWNRYPTYDVYVDMMRNFQNSFPGLCHLDTIGLSENGRLLLCLQVSNFSNAETIKPKFFYSSSIHGDELTGMVTLLRLCDSLLSSFESDSEISNLLSSTVIYICPLANPDGAYAGGNSTVANARRYNANYVDLNRNFPDPVLGQHPDQEEFQAETMAFMNYAKRERFDVSVNLHGGAEVCNYPWDCWRSEQREHCDKDWFLEICNSFISDVRESSPIDYFTDVSYNGITNGGDWYVINGSRQDYHNYFLRCREITLEISTSKTPQASSLPRYWQYLGKGLINFVSNSTKGIKGIVKDSVSGLVLDSVKIEIENINEDGLFVYSKADGSYFRALLDGTYQVKFSKDGYEDKHISFSTTSNWATEEVILMKSTDVSIEQTLQTMDESIIYPNPATDFLTIKTNSESYYDIIDSRGIVLQQGSINLGVNNVRITNLQNGTYIIRLYDKGKKHPNKTITFIKQVTK